MGGYLAVPFAVLTGLVQADMDTLDRGRPDRATAPPRTGPIETRWERRRFAAKLVNPANRRKLTVIVVGTGLAGGSAAATLAEAGYRVQSYCYQDSPRRAHSIAAQGGINAAKNYRNDGDSIYRLFYDTVKGGDFRSRESNVYRLAQLCGEHHRPVRGAGRPVRPRVRRPAGQPLVRRRPGVPHVLRPRPDRPAVAARRVPGDGAADRGRHHRDERPARDARAARRRRAGPRHRGPGPGHRRDQRRVADAVVLASGGYGNVFFLSTNAKGCNVTATWRAHRKGALFANPCYTQIHPTCIPESGPHQSKLTLMSESLRNDGRVWVPLAAERSPGRPATSREDERDYYLERIYPSFGNPGPPRHRLAGREERLRRGPRRRPRRARRLPGLRRRDRPAGPQAVEAKYGNLFEMYQRITGEDPYAVPDADLSGRALHDGRPLGRLRPAVHDPRACSSSARPTSPTTAPTGSAPPR